MSQAIKNQQLATLAEGKSHCLYNKELVPDFRAAMLEPSYWQQRDAITGSAQGRGTTWFIAYQDEHNLNHDWVLRHYYRGGLIGKVINDKYFFTGLENTRAAREYHLLNKLQSLALPAPKPIAYRVIKQGLFYQADLLSSRIEHAQDLVAILSKGEVVEQVWLEIGRVIRRFHDAGIYHHDLNSHNILIDEQNKVWLIDFDQGEKRAVSSSWQQANMARLLRSFEKEKMKLPTFQWQKSDWQLLLEGYLLEN